ncbi:LAMI_0G14312g1_1 [Lachancea mirantina]|uniref:LAMI_0G14312g1_1 n=1 Tax=Lachancea mirantina TaxID=1230905 RepID=A0A1G4KBZ6_9SACH|nr:LAMI_0G14312g1_1 [Lachancea mirantina]
MDIVELQELQATTGLTPRSILLKDGETTATMYPIPAHPDRLPAGLLAFLLDEFNMEVEKGDSLPFYQSLSLDEFNKIWFHRHGLVCIMVLGEIPELDYSNDDEENHEIMADATADDGRAEMFRNTPQYIRRKERRNLNLNIQWEKQCLGTFNLHPAYPGRSSHVVTGTFLVNAGIRGKGIGRTLLECFLDWCPKLGFTSAVFPLIYGTNVGIRRLLEALNFRRVGKLPESAILKGCDVPVDSFIYAKEFTHVSKTIDLLNAPNKHFAKYERLKYYLEHGKYPDNCDRNEKARLRASAKYHTVQNGKLMRQGREVVYIPERQLEVAFEVHQISHQGINKVTTKIAERYHWKGIKNTVARIVASCPLCKDQNHDDIGIVVDPGSPQQQAHMLVRDQSEVDHSAQLSQMAAAVVGSLQTRDFDNSRTPPDTNQRKRSKPTIHRIKFNDSKEAIVSSHDVLHNAQSMNNFSDLARPNNSGKRRYLDVAMGASEALNRTPHGTDITSGPSTVQIEDEDNSQIDDALLDLEDNVMAAVQAVHNEQQHKDSPLDHTSERFY